MVGVPYHSTRTCMLDGMTSLATLRYLTLPYGSAFSNVPGKDLNPAPGKSH